MVIPWDLATYKAHNDTAVLQAYGLLKPLTSMQQVANAPGPFQFGFRVENWHLGFQHIAGNS